MGSNNCFCRIFADAFPPWRRANTQLNAPERQTANAFAFAEVLTLTGG